MNKYLPLLIFSFLSLTINQAFAQADASVETFESPATTNPCPGVLPITINIYNNDFVDITEVVLDWSINSVPQLPVTWTGILAAGNSVPIVLEPAFDFQNGIQYEIQVTIQSVNTLPDPNSSNDIGTQIFVTNTVYYPIFYWDGCQLDCQNHDDYLSIQWYKDGAPDLNAPDSQYYTPSQPGTYTVVGLTFDSCDAVADTSYFVNPPTWDITSLGLTEFCEGDSVGLVFSASVPVFSLSWNTGESTDTIYAATNGWHVVTGITNNSCPVADSFLVTVHPLPVLTISDMNDTLVSSYSGLHQWYLNGNQIGGAHDSTYVPTQSGIYYATATDVYGCVGTSNSINWIFPGISIPVTVTDIMMYPNPARDILNIKFNSSYEYVILQIYDLSGRLVKSEEITGDQTIDISSLDEGAYNCVFKGEGKMFTQKLVKTF